MNPSVEIMMGYAGSEVVGQPVEKVLIGPERLMPALFCPAVIQRITWEMYISRRYGDAFLALVIFPVMQADKIKQIIIFITDLSEEEQTRLNPTARAPPSREITAISPMRCGTN
jgi:PAS domain S-box-containing protein